MSPSKPLSRTRTPRYFAAEANRLARSRPPGLAAETTLIILRAMLRTFLSLVLVPLVLALASATALHAAPSDPKRLAQFGSWGAYTYTENGGKFCYVAGQPNERKGSVPKRGEAYVLVTNRVAAGAFGEVSLVPGYPFQPKSEPVATIDKAAFPFYVGTDTAWLKDKGDAKLLRAMEAGREMTVAGTAAKGGKTVDTYSLIGFTKALQEINKACPHAEAKGPAKASARKK